MTEAEWIRKLEQHPEGFELDGAGRNCPICHSAMGKAAGWYDKRGLKCKACQQALEKRIIPASLMTKPDSYYTEIELGLKFNLEKPVLNAWIKKGIIKARVIPALDKGTHIRLFLLNDNKGFLPPKKLLQGGCHIEERDGQSEYVFGPWYWYGDPLQRLAKYGIIRYIAWDTPKGTLEVSRTLKHILEFFD